MLKQYNSSPEEINAIPLRSLFKVEIKCPIPTAHVKVTIPSRVMDPKRSVTGETLRLVNMAIVAGTKNTPSIANKSQFGPILTFVGRSAYSTPIATSPRIAAQCGAMIILFGPDPGFGSCSPEVLDPF